MNLPILLLCLLLSTVYGRADSIALSAASSSATQVPSIPGGSLVTITSSGIISLGAGLTVFADGSLNSLTGDALDIYPYARFGASYPTISGGDGINHFPGGGFNFDEIPGSFGSYGPPTTDTTDPTAIRFGCVVARFVFPDGSTPWVAVGREATLRSPLVDSTLELVVHDTFHENNSDAFSLDVSTTPIVSSDPDFSYTVAEGTITLRWRADSDWDLYTSIDLGSEAWSLITTFSRVAEGYRIVDLPMSSNRRFFRLQR